MSKRTVLEVYRDNSSIVVVAELQGEAKAISLGRISIPKGLRRPPLTVEAIKEQNAWRRQYIEELRTYQRKHPVLTIFSHSREGGYFLGSHLSEVEAIRCAEQAGLGVFDCAIYEFEDAQEVARVSLQREIDNEQEQQSAAA